MVVTQNTPPPPIVSLYSFFDRLVEHVFSISLFPCDVLCLIFKVYSQNIYMVLRAAGGRTFGFTVLTPIRSRYRTIQSSKTQIGMLK